MAVPANAKDALLAWAYRVFAARNAYTAPKAKAEFVAVCHTILPEIASMAANLPLDPLEAVQRARAEQDRLVNEIWETRSDG
jgi:hypothetical protein